MGREHEPPGFRHYSDGEVAVHGDPPGALFVRRRLAVVGTDDHKQTHGGPVGSYVHELWLRKCDERWVHVYAMPARTRAVTPPPLSWWVVVRNGRGERVGERSGPHTHDDARAVANDRWSALRALVDVAPEAFALPPVARPHVDRVRSPA